MNIEELIDIAYEIGMSQYREEIVEFITFLIDKDIKNFLEIGTFKGGTFYMLSQIATGMKITIDSCSNIQEDGCEYIHDYDLTKNVVKSLDGIFVDGDSHSHLTVDKVKDILGDQKLDLLFIDGDHTYEGVKTDYILYSELVKEGGYIAFHDIKNNVLNCKVHDLWNELKIENKIALEIISEEICDCGIGVLQK